MGRWIKFVWEMIFQATYLLWERDRGFKHDVKYLLKWARMYNKTLGLTTQK